MLKPPKQRGQKLKLKSINAYLIHLTSIHPTSHPFKAVGLR
jgi:hypothetical protein